MIRNTGKKALYEVIGVNRHKTAGGGITKSLPTEQSAEQPTLWLKKPRMLQFNAGRVEMSVPYQLAVAVLLSCILMIVVVFRLGQLSGPKSDESAGTVVRSTRSQPTVTELPTDTATQKTVPVTTAPPILVPAEAKTEKSRKQEPSKTAAANRIVIQICQEKKSLQPVVLYFAQHDIETEIFEIDGRYYLVSSKKYENPEKDGTNGFLAKKHIMEVGANYRSPPGYNSFGITPFQDAYGMKFDD